MSTHQTVWDARRSGCLHSRSHAATRHKAQRWTRRTFLGATISGAASLLALSVVPVAARQTITAQSASSGDMQALIAAAQKEGQPTVIALPHDWLNYGQLIDSFQSKYGLQVNELNPDAGSGDELEAIKRDCCSRTQSPSGTRFRIRSRIRMATGMAITTA